jgi:hypothetical protein
MTDRDDTRRDALPEHETRDIEHETAGGGVLAQGGTAIDRGTGTLGGTAQGPEVDDDEADPIEDPLLGGNEALIGSQKAADLAAPGEVDPAR